MIPRSAVQMIANALTSYSARRVVIIVGLFFDSDGCRCGRGTCDGAQVRQFLY